MCCRVDGRNSFLFLFSSDSKKLRLCVFFFGWFMQKNGIKGGRSLRSLVPDKQIRVAEKLSTKKKVPIGRRRWFIVFQTHPNIVVKKKKKLFLYYCYYYYHHHPYRVLFLFDTHRVQSILLIFLIRKCRNISGGEGKCWNTSMRVACSVEVARIYYCSDACPNINFTVWTRRNLLQRVRVLMK